MSKLANIFLNQESESVNQILCSTFQDTFTNKPITLTLTDIYLKFSYSDQLCSEKILINSDFHFKMIVHNRELFGIQFRKKGMHPISLYSQTIEILRKWYLELKKILYQEDFHATYRTLRKLGKGAFSTVYMVQRIIDKKVFAVKNFSKFHSKLNSQQDKWLKNQISLMRTLDHCSIMKLEEVFDQINNILVVVEYAEGTSLDHYCDQYSQKLQPRQVLQILRKLTDALIYMKSQNIVHRDLKPQNIILRKGLKPIIIDFGFAVDLNDVSKDMRNACGTPGFIAPEIYNKQTLGLNSSNDVYSLGVIIYTLLYGPLHVGSSLQEIIEKNRTSSIPKHLRLSDNPLDGLLCRMLEKYPTNRISIQDVAKWNSIKVQKASIFDFVDLVHS